MTNGSCHSTAESKVQPCVKPACSARTIRSTRVLAGGSFCSTSPKSMAFPFSSEPISGQVLAGGARRVGTLAGPAEVLAVVDDHPAAGQDRLRVPGHGLALVRRVVDVHVVGRGGH